LPASLRTFFRTLDRQIEFRAALERHCREAALIVERAGVNPAAIDPLAAPRARIASGWKTPNDRAPAILPRLSGHTCLLPHS
jgi:hypothetical protein